MGHETGNGGQSTGTITIQLQLWATGDFLWANIRYSVILPKSEGAG